LHDGKAVFVKHCIQPGCTEARQGLWMRDMTKAGFVKTKQSKTRHAWYTASYLLCPPKHTPPITTVVIQHYRAHCSAWAWQKVSTVHIPADTSYKPN